MLLQAKIEKDVIKVSDLFQQVEGVVTARESKIVAVGEAYGEASRDVEKPDRVWEQRLTMPGDVFSTLPRQLDTLAQLLLCSLIFKLNNSTRSFGCCL
jgi:hypothetical protein